MNTKTLLWATAFGGLAALFALPASAGTLTVLASFDGKNGSNPDGALIVSNTGELYGTTFSGGASTTCSGGCGTVFDLTPPALGETAWSETVLTSFNGKNGAGPQGNLVADNAGNLFGATESGTIFRLAPPTAGKASWSETILTRLTSKTGADPLGSLLSDNAGNFYGAAVTGGALGSGTVFKLSPPSAGKTAWTVSVLVTFDVTNGRNPSSGLIADSTGNLYGMTSEGGAFGDGTVFEVTPPATGKKGWTETVLTSFNGTNGASPFGGLITDGKGNFYGTTSAGGTSNNGTVFKLSPPAAGNTTWSETVLTSFNGKDGQYPTGGLIADSAGNLYGTTQLGGAFTTSCIVGCGTVFKLTKPATGKTAWKETVLASFNEKNGFIPVNNLIADSAGNLYGTTYMGGAFGSGTMFEVTR